MKSLLLLGCIAFSSLSFADYSKHPAAESIISELITEHGFDQKYVIKVLESAKKQDKILKSMSSPAEFTWTWERYKKLFLEEKRIANGREFMAANKELFKKVEDEFGVPKEIITAILGVETRYGKIKGNYRVLDSLATLGFDFPRRAKFFKSELIQFFLLTQENNLDIFDVKGSYAGAMGYGQFISSSYRAYAVDYDGDGYADLFHSVPDAIASVANYLKVHGWQRDGKIITDTKINNVSKPSTTNFKSKKFMTLMFTENTNKQYIVEKGNSLTEIAQQNNMSLEALMSLNNLIDPNQIYVGQVLMLENEKDIFYIGDDNFIAITKYNRSHFYAKAVYDLSLEF
ncbi:lytic murein transglycosylase B [Gammaproteobacteria bacterium]|nr:lytic murein transglycosylase B [Gammaproteobacteria bacterium]